MLCICSLNNKSPLKRPILITKYIFYTHASERFTAQELLSKSYLRHDGELEPCQDREATPKSRPSPDSREETIDMTQQMAIWPLALQSGLSKMTVRTVLGKIFHCWLPILIRFACFMMRLNLPQCHSDSSIFSRVPLSMLFSFHFITFKNQIMLQ